MKRRQLISATAAWTAGVALPALAEPLGEPGLSDNEVVFGQTALLSGPLGQQILSVQAGALMAFDEVNAAGGVAGRRIRLVSLDDELKPDKAVANARTLLGKTRVLGLFGCVGSGTVGALAPVLKEFNAPLIASYAVSDSARERTRGFGYFLRAGYGRELESLVKLVTTIGLKRVALAHLANPGGEEALARLRLELAKHQLEVVASGGVQNDGKNAPAVAQRLAAQSPQAVVMFLGGSLASDVITGMWGVGATPNFYGMSIVPGELIAKRLGARSRTLSIAQAMPYPWNVADPHLREYQMKAAKRQLPVSYYTAEGYLSGQLLIEGLKRAGRNPSRQRLSAELSMLKMRLAGMDLDFTGGRHTGSRFVELVQLTHEGRFVR